MNELLKRISMVEEGLARIALKREEVKALVKGVFSFKEPDAFTKVFYHFIEADGFPVFDVEVEVLFDEEKKLREELVFLKKELGLKRADGGKGSVVDCEALFKEKLRELIDGFEGYEVRDGKLFLACSCAPKRLNVGNVFRGS